jgi:hypothetical protein
LTAESPSPAGYSGKPTATKLGLKAGQRLWVLGEADDYADRVGPLPEGLLRVDAGPAEVIHLFVRRRAELEAALPALLPALVERGMLWVSWPKKPRASPPGQLSEDDLRAVALPLGLVDVKVCAVDATWSGLKLVRRRAPAGGAAR